MRCFPINTIALLKYPQVPFKALVFILSALDNPTCLACRAFLMLTMNYDFLYLPIALDCLNKASIKGIVMANLQLAQFYYRGIIFQQNKKNAIHYASLAAESGNKFAIEYLEYISNPENEMPQPATIEETLLGNVEYFYKYSIVNQEQTCNNRSFY